MRALVYHGPGHRSYDEVPDPKIEADGDVVVRIDTTTICGTDLHILRGDVPTVEPGRALGHEAVGTVVETGIGVRSLREGDRVLVSCITSCGHCTYCRKGQYGLCQGGGGWIFGHLIDGLQAEYARVPFADTSVYVLPSDVTDEQAIYLADILPTGYEVGVRNGGVSPGDTVVIVGAGPIGLSTVLGSTLYSPARIVVVEPAESRREKAREFGADLAVTPDHALDAVMRLTDGLGADVVIEAVGVSATFELCTELVRPGGRVADVGVHGEPATLHLEKLWIKDVTITTGLVDTVTTPTLLRLIRSGRLDPSVFTTHRFELDEAMLAYDTFAAAADTGALKVLMSNA